MVIRTEFSGVKAGDHVYGILRESLNYYVSPEFIPLEAFQNYFIKNNLDRLKVLENPHNLPWSTYIGVLGMPGKILGVQLMLLLDKQVLSRPIRLHGLERVFQSEESTHIFYPCYRHLIF